MSRVISMVDSLVTPPAVPPMTVAYAKKHIKSISTAEDLLIASWIQAAGSYFEEQTGRQIITATREVWLDGFPTYVWPGGGRIELPHPPLQSVVSVRYVDGSGSLLNFDDGASPAVQSYSVKAPQGPYAARGWLEPNYGGMWPTPRAESGSVRIQYTCGYGDSVEDVPELITAILCFLVAHFDQFRSAVHEAQRGSIEELPFGVRIMMDGFKYSALPTMVLRSEAPWV